MLHVVRAGDSLASLAGDYGCTLADLLDRNGHRTFTLLDPLRDGQVIHVPEADMIGGPPLGGILSGTTSQGLPQDPRAWGNPSGSSYSDNDNQQHSINPTNVAAAAAMYQGGLAGWNQWKQLEQYAQLPGDTFDPGSMPPPVNAGESQLSYFQRVLGGNWQPGSGGFNLFQPSTWGSALKGVANAIATVAQAFGFVGAGQFVFTINAIADAANGNLSGAQLLSQAAAAAKLDYDNLQTSRNVAQAVQDGDWGKVWNLVTQNGADLTNLQYAFAPGPAPDASGNLTIPPATGTKSGAASTSTTGSTIATVAVGTGLAAAVGAALWVGLGHQLTFAAIKAGLKHLFKGNDR